jgi:transcription elongation factor GreB
VSKAFTKESDLPVVTLRPRLTSPLPPGAKNYLTTSGAEQLKRELNALLNEERPRLVGGSDETADELRILQQRVEQIQEILQSAVIVPLPVAPDDVVRFGATVTVEERRGAQSTYRIVGVDETDLDRNWVSWISPIAKALLNARVGQQVRFKFPSGEEVLKVIRISYE